MAELAQSCWLPCFGYATAAALAAAVGRRNRQLGDEASLFWYMTSGVLALMAVGRVVDLGNALADFGRRTASSQGWSDMRRPVQAVTVLVIIILVSALASVAIRRTSSRWNPDVAMTVVVTLLVGLAAVRSISLHQLDALLDRNWIGMRVGVVLELVGILAAIALAGRRLTPNPNSRRRISRSKPRTSR